MSQNRPETVSRYLYSLSASFFNFSIFFPKSCKNYTKNDVRFLKSFLQLRHFSLIFPSVSSNFLRSNTKFQPNFFEKPFHISLKSFLKNFQTFFHFLKMLLKFFLLYIFLKYVLGLLKISLFSKISLKFYP